MKFDQWVGALLLCALGATVFVFIGYLITRTIVDIQTAELIIVWYFCFLSNLGGFLFAKYLS